MVVLGGVVGVSSHVDLTDILNEFYGQKVTRQVTYLAFAMVGLTFATIYASGAMPWSSLALSPDWQGVKPHDFDVVFTQATRIQLASMVAFLIGNLVDIWAFHAIKKLTGERMLWLRATGSTVISQLIDTIVISALVWGDKITISRYVSVVITSYVIKVFAAIGVTPVIYGLHGLLARRFGIEPVHATDADDVAHDRDRASCQRQSRRCGQARQARQTVTANYLVPTGTILASR